MYKLTLSMIVKDEEHIIKECLQSASKYIDYYIICDTGSTDKTKQIIKEYFDSVNIPGEIHDHQWSDFGTNRSKALELCKGKTKWAIMIDADDYIEGDMPTTFDDNLDGYTVKIARGNFEWKRVQLFNLQHKSWRYEEPIHEYPITDMPMNIGYLDGNYSFQVRTAGNRTISCATPQEKYWKDYLLLKEAIVKDPTSQRKQFYLAQSAFDSFKFDIAEEEYQKRVEMGGWPEELFFSQMRVALCRELQNKPIELVTDAMLKAWELRPMRAEPLYHLSNIYRKHGRLAAAFMISFQALSIPKPEADILFVDGDVYKWGILDEIVSTAHAVGKFHLGLQAADKLLNENRLPEHQIERVQKNRQSYYDKVMEIQAHLAQVHQQQALAQTKLNTEPPPTTTLNLTNATTKMSSGLSVYGQDSKNSSVSVKTFKKKKTKR